MIFSSPDLQMSIWRFIFFLILARQICKCQFGVENILKALKINGLGSWVALVGFGPVIDDPLFFLFFIADLDREIGMGVPVVAVAPFVLLKELDQDLFVHPGLNGEFGVLKAFKLLVFLVVL